MLNERLAIIDRRNVEVMTTKPKPDKNANTTVDTNEYRAVRLEKLEKLKAMGVEPYPYLYERSACSVDLQDKYKDLADGDVTEDVVKIAGRIMAIRNNGMFISLQDDGGRIQVFTHKDNPVNQAQLDMLPLLDIGDIIGVEGYVRRTPRGELTVNSKAITLLTKTLLPLPDKFHGLTDVEARYRQRYLDLIMNEDSRKTLRARSQVVRVIRELLDGQGFMEVETPMLQVIPGGTEAKPFITHHNALGIDLYMRIAPELYLKRLLVGGLNDKVYEINRNFRNEGISIRHNPEFTMLEAYLAYCDYNDMRGLVEEIVCAAAQAINGSLKFTYQGQEIDLTPPWDVKPILQLVEEATGINFDTIKDAAAARKVAKDLDVPVDEQASWGKVVAEVFEKKVEHTLVQPVHVSDFPKDVSPLVKVHRQNPRLAERIDTYICGMEICPIYSELTDPVDQRARFEDQSSQRDAGDDEAMRMDEDFLTAMEYGLPPAAGTGIGIDRLTMLLTDSPSIREVIAFPTMKPRLETSTAAAQEKAASGFMHDASVVQAYPNHYTGIIVVKDFAKNDQLKVHIAQLLKEIETANKQGLEEACAAWQATFAKMQAPKGAKSSLVNLRDFYAEKGRVFQVNPIVDFYNHYSLAKHVPMGAYDLTKVSGQLKLLIADKGLSFKPLGKPDKPQVTQAGEVVYMDDAKVTCRFWNEKDSDVTKITNKTKDVLFMFDMVAADAKAAKVAFDGYQKDFKAAFGDALKTAAVLGPDLSDSILF